LNRPGVPPETPAILQAVLIAKQNGELSVRAPVEDIATLLSGIANAGPAITQDAGTFEQLEQLYDGFLRILMQGYGGAKEPYQADTQERTRAATRGPAIRSSSSS
jgi:hypothetical protein